MATNNLTIASATGKARHSPRLALTPKPAVETTKKVRITVNDVLRHGLLNGNPGSRIPVLKAYPNCDSRSNRLIAKFDLRRQIVPDAKSSEKPVQPRLILPNRIHFEDPKVVKMLSDKEFCEVCNSVINESLTDNEQLHIDACRTLDIVLPETRNRNFDFFQSISQINRKKRLKILVSLSILKDETVAVIASKLSTIDFFNDCLQSIQPRLMNWLLSEYADNENILKNIDNNVNENEADEERIVESTLKLLDRLCNLTSSELNICQFDTFIMDKVVLLAYMGHCKQRTQALPVLETAIKNDLGVRVRTRSPDIWDKYKTTLQNVYCKRMTTLVNASNLDWSRQWETSITFIGTDLHRGSGLVNSLLKVEELAFKSGDINRRQAFLSWKLLIDNFALNQRELATNRRIKLLCVPLNAKNSKTELMVVTKMEVWWHLVYKIYPSLAECIKTVLEPFLALCFGPFSDDRPLFIQKTDSNVALGKKFPKTQVYAINAFLQLIVNKDDMKKISSHDIPEQLPNPVSNSVFETSYKVFIHCFGEIVIGLGLVPNDAFENKLDVCKILWNNLINRIEGYDKMKVSMYKEILNVIVEMIRNSFHKVITVKQFLLHIVLTDFENIARNMHFTEHTLMELVKMFLQVDNFPYFVSEHYSSLESLLWHLIKPKNSDVYNPQTLELMQTILCILDDARKNDTNVPAVCEVWCVLAKTAKKYTEESRNINEGTTTEHNFKTIDSILSFPFNLSTDDCLKMMSMSKAWTELYKMFDLQAELVVSVKPNEILEKTSIMIIKALKKNVNCRDFAVLCIDTLLSAVNYDNFYETKEVPAFVNLLKDLTMECLRINSCTAAKVLKSLSAFFLHVFSQNVEKTVLYLKDIEPVVKYMLIKDDSDFKKETKCEISKTLCVIIGLFKKLQTSLDHKLLDCYRQVIVKAMMHLNEEINSTASSVLDLKDSIDSKSKKVLEDIIEELQKSSAKSNIDTPSISEKTTKKKTGPVKPIGSFLNRKTMSPSNSTKIVQNGKEPIKSNIPIIEPDSQDFVVINTDRNFDVNLMTEHQKEKLKKRKDDIPAMYNDLTVSNSQDSQGLQQGFDTRMKKLINQMQESSSNNNKESKTSSPSLNFKNITQSPLIKNILQSPIIADKPAAGTNSQAITTSPKVQPKKSTTEQEISEIKDSPKSATKSEQAPIVAKKLDFESREEFPADPEQTSPSIIENAKMRRRNIPEESNGTGVGENQTNRLTRRSLQPTTVGQRGVNLRRSNSSEQLSKRGKKRRNSESNSESMLDIEREKRPRRDATSDQLNSSGDSSKSSDSSSDPKSANSQEVDGKKFSKRQLNEMSRLKIDMVFQPLPSRRSVGKTNDPTNKKMTIAKEDNSKEGKIVVPPTAKVESQNQPPTPTRNPTTTTTTTATATTRRSLKGSNPGPTKSDEKEDKKKESPQKKLMPQENSESSNKVMMIRKSLTGKSEPFGAFKKKNVQLDDTQEEVLIEDVSTQIETPKKVKESPVKPTEMEIDDSTINEIKSSQDSDIVESSQEPTNSNSKMDKAECFIRIKKVEVIKHARNSEETEKLEKDKEVILETPTDVNETSLSIIPATLVSEKPAAIQSEVKVTDANAGKPSTSAIHVSSPKGTKNRFFKSKAFPLNNRAAQMLACVTNQSITEKLTHSDNTKTDNSAVTEEVTIVPQPKKEKIQKESERISSPSGGNRLEKMFNNLNNKKQTMVSERCASPSMSMFCLTRNENERSSPKSDKHQEKESNDDVSIEKEPSFNSSPNGKAKKELPMLEWSNANPPSLTASPSASILKKIQEVVDVDTPNTKKRVSFADPPVSREMGYEIMTDSSSPPRLEKLPTIRSPISRKEPKRHTRLRLIQTDTEIREKENELTSSNEITSEPVIPNFAKIKLTTILSEIPEIMDKATFANTMDVDMFMESDKPSTEDEIIDVEKVSSQTDQNNSSIKLDSINLSNFLKKSDSQTNALEDTVDVENISSSMESLNSMTDKPVQSSSQQSGEQVNDTMPVTESVFSNPQMSQETQNSVAQLIEPDNLDSTLPVYPSLISCADAVESVSADLVDPLFTDNLSKHLDVQFIRSVGDLAQLTERDINRLPIKSPKVDCVKKALSRFEKKSETKTPVNRRLSNVVSSSTPLGNKRRDRSKTDSESFEDMMKNVSEVSYELRRAPKRTSTDNAMQTSPMKKPKRSNEEAWVELTEQCDDTFLFEAFMKKFTVERILKAYKEKMKNKSDEELKKETLNILGLSEVSNSEASFKAFVSTAGLQKVIQLLSKTGDGEGEFHTEVFNTLSENEKNAVLKTWMMKMDICELIRIQSETLTTRVQQMQKK